MENIDNVSVLNFFLIKFYKTAYKLQKKKTHSFLCFLIMVKTIMGDPEQHKNLVPPTDNRDNDFMENC